MIVNLSDEFDLEKIVYSGQCFRPKKLKENEYLFITGDNYVVIEQLNAGQLEVSCDADTWNNVWHEYFDLSFTYKELRKSINEEDSFMIRSGIAGEGIRILRQDKWEMIISYIISQRKSIPAIRTSVEKICKLYGRIIGNVEGEEIYSFPTAEEMRLATTEELASCGLGYRVEYIQDATFKVLNGEINIEQIESLDDEELFAKLKSVKGIGDKVANCVLLFAYHRTGRAPIDTWILKVMNEQYGGENPFVQYGDVAGIMQQYVFYYVQNRKGLS